MMHSHGTAAVRQLTGDARGNYGIWRALVGDYEAIAGHASNECPWEVRKQFELFDNVQIISTP